ncbi:hypothetical protein Y1Q_0007841 [Alligator mississippiensis]|uniref:Uncharacterized protein n=1 Tax=Alligator mississippiensis TaxID=8496 RepID=A0A151LZ57_ALLMI|nr:hypothetical protein Y1Q_0007841 [Alligator mississippiensis]
MWERIHSEDRMSFESDMDQESPEHQPLLPVLSQAWRVTEERVGTCLTSSLTFTPMLQDDGVRVRCVFLHEAERIREERVSSEIRVWDLGEVSLLQALVPGKPVTVQHLLSGSYAKQLAMTWLGKRAMKETRPLGTSDPHRIHTPTSSRAPDGKSYSMESELLIPHAGPEDDWAENKALKKPKSRSSWLKGSSKSFRASKR